MYDKEKQCQLKIWSLIKNNDFFSHENPSGLMLPNSNPFLLTLPNVLEQKPSSTSLETIVCFHAKKKNFKISRRFFDASTSINWYFKDILENPAQKLIV